MIKNKLKILLSWVEKVNSDNTSLRVKKKKWS